MDRSEFIVDLGDIPPEGLRREMEVDGSGEEGLNLAVPLAGSLRAGFVLTRFRERVLLQGEVAAPVRLECSRCLSVFASTLRSEVEMYLQEQEGESDSEEEVELTPEEIGIQHLNEGRIDLRAVLSEQIHLALPVKPLCREDCRGLCPRCGVDLNSQPCGCTDEVHDPRWEVLKKLKVK